jgi:hypothetical protein
MKFVAIFCSENVAAFPRWFWKSALGTGSAPQVQASCRLQIGIILMHQCLVTSSQNSFFRKFRK